MSAANWHIQCERTGNVSVTHPCGPSLVIPTSVPSPCSTTGGSGPRWVSVDSSPAHITPCHFHPCYPVILLLLDVNNPQAAPNTVASDFTTELFLDRSPGLEPLQMPLSLSPQPDSAHRLFLIRVLTKTNKTEDWELSHVYSPLSSCASDVVRATCTVGT